MGLARNSPGIGLTRLGCGRNSVPPALFESREPNFQTWKQPSRAGFRFGISGSAPLCHEVPETDVGPIEAASDNSLGAPLLRSSGPFFPTSPLVALARRGLAGASQSLPRCARCVRRPPSERDAGNHLPNKALQARDPTCVRCDAPAPCGANWSRGKSPPLLYLRPPRGARRDIRAHPRAQK